MGITSQNECLDIFTFQAGLQGEGRYLWCRSDAVPLLLLNGLCVLPSFPLFVAYGAGMSSEGVWNIHIYVALRSPFCPWLELGWVLSLHWVDECGEIPQTINVSIGCCFPPCRSKGWTVPFKMGNPSYSPCSSLDFLPVSPGWQGWQCGCMSDEKVSVEAGFCRQALIFSSFIAREWQPCSTPFSSPSISIQTHLCLCSLEDNDNPA